MNSSSLKLVESLAGCDITVLYYGVILRLVISQCDITPCNIAGLDLELASIEIFISDSGMHRSGVHAEE